MNIYVIANQQSVSVHTDPECLSIKRAEHPVREVDRSVYPNRPVCKHCTGEARTPVTVNQRKCLSCGDELDPDGSCEFCEAMDQAGIPA